jgi:hypothetical protein
MQIMHDTYMYNCVHFLKYVVSITVIAVGLVV